MRIAFVQARAVDESLAICDVSARLRALGHRTRVVLDNHEDDLAGCLRGWRAELLVVQAPLLGGPWLREVRTRLPRLPTLFAGTGLTFVSEEVLIADGDVGLQGEIDRALPALVSAMEEGALPGERDLPGLVIRQGGAIRAVPPGPEPTGLDDDPLPDRALYFDAYPFLASFPWKRFSTGRGCIHACGYCYLPPLRQLHGGRRGVRRKSVDKVIAEVQAVRARWPLTQVHFADDLFAPKVGWLDEFADRWPREVGLPFSANSSPETITDRNAASLARAGARLVGLGVEAAGEQRRRDRLGRRSTDEAIEGAVRRLQQRGVRVHTFNLLGAPGASFADDLETLRWNQRMGVRSCRATLTFPMAGTSMQRRYLEGGGDPEALRDADKSAARAWCLPEGPDRARVESLLAVFRWAVATGASPATVRALCQVPAGLLRPLTWYDALVELRWSGVGWKDGLRYGLQSGRPVHRKTYHESML